jgi:hypothetical protein
MTKTSRRTKIAAPTLPSPTAREAEAIADAKNRVSKRRLRVQVKGEWSDAFG